MKKSTSLISRLADLWYVPTYEYVTLQPLMIEPLHILFIRIIS